jgi:hypothetical protein
LWFTIELFAKALGQQFDNCHDAQLIFWRICNFFFEFGLASPDLILNYFLASTYFILDGSYAVFHFVLACTHVGFTFFKLFHDEL